MFTPGSRACAYRTASGRAKWLSRDPAGENASENTYGFCRNNGLGCFDLLGLACDEVLVAIYVTRKEDRLNIESLLSTIKPIHKRLKWRVFNGSVPGGKVGKQSGYKQTWKSVYFIDARVVIAGNVGGPLGSGATAFKPIIWPDRIKNNFEESQQRGGVPPAWANASADEAYYHFSGYALAHELLHSLGCDHTGGPTNLMSADRTWDWLVKPPILDNQTTRKIVDKLDVE
jgi:hypothetical protein